jgi:hypothetical protein
MYPSSAEKEVLINAEALMKDVMNRYDPSHDHYHGELLIHERVVSQRVADVVS